MSAEVVDLTRSEKALGGIGKQYGFRYDAMQREEGRAEWVVRFLKEGRTVLASIDDQTMHELRELARQLEAAS